LQKLADTVVQFLYNHNCSKQHQTVLNLLETLYLRVFERLQSSELQ